MLGIGLRKEVPVPKAKTETDTPGAPAPQPAEPARDALGERLRGMFQAVESAPVPEEITRLVEALEKKRRKGRRRPGDH